jgi:hypothetical protein
MVSAPCRAESTPHPGEGSPSTGSGRSADRTGAWDGTQGQAGCQAGFPRHNDCDARGGQLSQRAQGIELGHSPTRLPAITAHTSSRCWEGAPAMVVSERISPTPGSIHISLTERIVPDGSVIARS